MKAKKLIMSMNLETHKFEFTSALKNSDLTQINLLMDIKENLVVVGAYFKQVLNQE